MITKPDFTTWQLLALYCWKFAIFVPCYAIGWIGHTLDDASFRVMSATAPAMVRGLMEQWDREYDPARGPLDQMGRR